MAGPKSSFEKRRFSRKRTKVDAVMVPVGDTAPIGCVILDFSEQGLFLQVPNDYSGSLKKGRNTQVFFSAETDSGKQYFQIDAQVARTAEDGVGVVFENISDSMLEALKKSGDTESLSAYSPNPRLFLTSSNQERFSQALKPFLQNNLPKIISEFFDDVEDEVEKKSDFAQSFDDITAQANIATVLRMNKSTLISSFCNTVMASLELTGEKKTSEHAEELEKQNLSLVDKNDFDEWLNYTNLIRKVNAHFKEKLYQLELKISYVTSFPRYLVKNPIDPEHLCEVFRNVIASLDNNTAARKMVYKAFQTTLTEHLTSFYNDFEKILVQHGAPPEIANEIVWKKNYPVNALRTNPGDYGNHQPHASFDSDAYYYQESSAAHNSPSYLKPNRQQPAVTETVSKLYELLNQNLHATAHSSDLRPTKATSIAGELEKIDYSIDDILTALAKLQASKSVYKSNQNTAALLESHLGEITSESGYFNSKALSTNDKRKLDVYDQLFDALLNELVLSPSIKPYLEKIKVPLIALTLQDANFLDNNDHPARNLLNQISSLDSLVDQNKSIKNIQIKDILDRLVAKISQSSINNPDVFTKANEELKEISAPIVKSRDANIRRVVENYEGKQRLEKARLTIQEHIDRRIAGKTIPNVIKAILDSGWQHLMVIAELNEDKQNLKRYLEVIDELLLWYENLDSITEDKLAGIEIELDFINHTLGSVCTNAFLHNKIVEDLTTTLLLTENRATRKSVDSLFIKPKDRKRGNKFISDRWYLEVDQFKVGDWFTFSLEQQTYEPLKLVWVGEISNVYVFVNRDGYKKQELNKDELVDMLQSGVITQIENLDEPLMDRATTTMLQKMQEKLIHSASHDPVTNLPNRKRFVALLKEHVSHTTNKQHVLGLLEIEDFRIITNVCGLVGGDQLLILVANILNKDLGNSAIVSRLGDKSFGFLLRDCPAEKGFDTAKALRDLINRSNFVWDDKSYTISVTIGLVPVIEPTSNVDELLQKADSVNISAKRSGHNRIVTFQENDETLKTQTDIHEWAGRIDRIFSEKRLFARCQKIEPINPEKNSHSHYEILLGVRDEYGKIIPPDKFIPAVEQCQRMPEIDRWIVENVFAWIVENKTSFEQLGGFAINLSGQSLNSEEFLNFLKERLAKQDIPADKITFEVTETVAAGSLVFTKRFISEIKQFGCKFSMDDFGTGYSSYSYLKSLDVDYLKIDGSFIKDIVDSSTDKVMVNSMNEIAHSLEMETIAEYVENMKIHAVLKEIGIDYAQGWGIHKPMPLSELLDSLKQ